MITTGYVWALADLYLERVDEPATCSDKHHGKDDVFIPIHEDRTCKLYDGTDEAECEHEEHRAHDKDDCQSH